MLQSPHVWGYLADAEDWLRKCQGVHAVTFFVESILKSILKRKREEIVADKEKMENRPEVQQCRIEDDFSFTTPYDAISASCSQKRF